MIVQARAFSRTHSSFTFTFARVSDPYAFSISLDLAGSTAHTLDLHWSGPPSPHQKYINLYRILYVEAASNEDGGVSPHHPRHRARPQLHPNEIQSVFKVAKIDSVNAVMLTGLRPLTNYQVWLQAYLRNGKVIESNVLDVSTNDGVAMRGPHGHGHGGMGIARICVICS